MKNRFLLCIAFAVFFYANFVFAADPHYLRSDWYNAEKAGLPKEEVKSIVITNDPDVYEKAAKIANGSLIPVDDTDEDINVSDTTDETVETGRIRNEKTKLPYWDLDGRGLIAFVRDECSISCPSGILRVLNIAISLSEPKSLIRLSSSER